MIDGASNHPTTHAIAAPTTPMNPERSMATPKSVPMKRQPNGADHNLAALRNAIESSKEVVGVHGVFNMSPTDHFGLDARSRVLVRIEGGVYKLVSQ